MKSVLFICIILLLTNFSFCVVRRAEIKAELETNEGESELLSEEVIMEADVQNIPRDILKAGEELMAGDVGLRDSSFHYRLWPAFDNHFVVMYCDDITKPSQDCTYVWGTGQIQMKRLSMQFDCNLVNYDNNWSARWTSGTYNKGSGCYMKLNCDGELSVFNGAGKPLWNAGSAGKKPNHCAARALVEDTLASGKVLATWDEGLRDLSGHYRFSSNSENQFIISYCSRASASTNDCEKIWGTGKSNTEGFVVRKDCNVVNYDLSDVTKWDTQTTGKGKSCNLKLSCNGNLELFSETGVNVWNSGSAGKKPSYCMGSSKDILPAGQTISAGDEGLKDISGHYRFWPAGDNHFVIMYCALASKPTSECDFIWGTGMVRTSRISIQSDCNLVNSNSDDSLMWHSKSNLKGFFGCYVKMQCDGNLVVYSKSGEVAWSSGTKDKKPSHCLGATKDILPSGQTISVGDAGLEDSSRHYRFWPAGDNHFVIMYCDDASKPTNQCSYLWGTGKTWTQQFRLQSDGNLVNFGDNNSVRWASATDGKGDGCYLKMLCSGDLVLYTKFGQPVWSSGTSGKKPTFCPVVPQIPKDLLQTGDVLAVGDNGLSDASNHYRFWANSLNQFVILYCEDSKSPSSQCSTLWSTGQSYTTKMRIDNDCNLVNTGVNSVLRWETKTSGKGESCYLKMQCDGALVLFSKSGDAVWNSETAGKKSSHCFETKDILPNGQSISVGDDGLYDQSKHYRLWPAPDNHFVLMYCPDPAMEINPQMQCAYLWGTQQAGTQKLTVTSDCNIVNFNSAGTIVWNSKTIAQGAGCYLKVQCNGDMVLNDRTGRTVWSTGTVGQKPSHC